MQTKVLGFTWGKFSTDVLMLDPVDYIIGADCFYDNSEGKAYSRSLLGNLNNIFSSCSLRG